MGVLFLGTCGTSGSQAHWRLHTLPSGHHGLAISCSTAQALPKQGSATLSPGLPVSVSIAQGHQSSFGTKSSSPHPLMEKMSKCIWCSWGVGGSESRSQSWSHYQDSAISLAHSPALCPAPLPPPPASEGADSSAACGQLRSFSAHHVPSWRLLIRCS